MEEPGGVTEDVVGLNQGAWKALTVDSGKADRESDEVLLSKIWTSNFWLQRNLAP